MNTSEKTSVLVKTSMLAAIATILSFLDFGLPIFPIFLKIDIADVPAILGSIILGPVSGILIELVKNLLHGIIGSSSAGIGELANFLIGASLVAPIGFFMQKEKNTKNFLFGGILSIITMVAVASVLNVYIILPLYEKFTPMDQIIAAANAINPNVKDLSSYILFICVPFNLLKGAVAMGLSAILFKLLEKPLLRKM